MNNPFKKKVRLTPLRGEAHNYSQDEYEYYNMLFRNLQRSDYVRSLDRTHLIIYLLHSLAFELSGVIANDLRNKSLKYCDYSDDGTLLHIAQCNAFWIYTWLIEDIYDCDYLELHDSSQAKYILDQVCMLFLQHDVGIFEEDIISQLSEVYKYKDESGVYSSGVDLYLSKLYAFDDIIILTRIIITYQANRKFNYFPSIEKLRSLSEHDMRDAVVSFYSGEYISYYPQYLDNGL